MQRPAESLAVLEDQRQVLGSFPAFRILPELNDAQKRFPHAQKRDPRVPNTQATRAKKKYEYAVCCWCSGAHRDGEVGLEPLQMLLHLALLTTRAESQERCRQSVCAIRVLFMALSMLSTRARARGGRTPRAQGGSRKTILPSVPPMSCQRKNRCQGPDIAERTQGRH